MLKLTSRIPARDNRGRVRNRRAWSTPTNPFLITYASIPFLLYHRLVSFTKAITGVLFKRKKQLPNGPPRKKPALNL